MRLADERYVENLTLKGYHSRSSKHGDALCVFLLEDFLRICDEARALAADGKLVYKLNHAIDKGSPEEWSMDLVLGPPKGKSRPSPHGLDGIREGVPEEVWLALDAKGIMTEHGKARRNRARDVTALHSVLHSRRPHAVVGACIVVNKSTVFQSKLRKETTLHKNIDRLVQEIVTLFEGVPEAGPTPGNRGLEGLGIVVVEFSGKPGATAKLVRDPPAPPRGSRLHYETFLQSLATAFSQRRRP